jgi:ABC-type ATPase involved in cell division
VQLVGNWWPWRARDRQSQTDPGRRAHRNLHSSQGKETMELFKKLNGEGATVLQVTHSQANAAYGHRIVQLADGWVVA